MSSLPLEQHFYRDLDHPTVISKKIYCLAGPVCPIRNCVQGPASRSHITGDCQLNSGCSCRNCAASKCSPQGCPIRATKLMLAAILLSMTLPCTAPMGS